MPPNATSAVYSRARRLRLHDEHGLGAELVYDSAARVRQLRRNESLLADEVAERVGERPLAARRRFQHREQPAQVVRHLQPHP